MNYHPEGYDLFSTKFPVIGIDPVTKGTFKVIWGFLIFDEYGMICGEESPIEVRFQGKIEITSENNNPLYKIAKEQPLRLQGLIGSVNFGAEKRFIKIETISEYNIYPEINGVESIELNPVTFLLLDNLEYLENVQEYKWNNLL